MACTGDVPTSSSRGERRHCQFRGPHKEREFSQYAWSAALLHVPSCIRLLQQWSDWKILAQAEQAKHSTNLNWVAESLCRVFSGPSGQRLKEVCFGKPCFCSSDVGSGVCTDRHQSVGPGCAIPACASSLTESRCLHSCGTFHRRAGQDSCLADSTRKRPLANLVLKQCAPIP